MEELVESYKVEDLVNKMKEIKQQMIQEKKERMTEERRKAELQRVIAKRRGEQGIINLHLIWFPVHPELNIQQFNSSGDWCTQKVASNTNFSHKKSPFVTGYCKKESWFFSVMTSLSIMTTLNGGSVDCLKKRGSEILLFILIFGYSNFYQRTAM